jgi:hypothetical protein
MPTATLLAALLAMSDAGKGTAQEPVQTGPEVTGSRSDSSPPLREIPPKDPQPGRRVHPWRRIPRPQAADAGTPDGGVADPPPESGPGHGSPSRRKAAERPRVPRNKSTPPDGGSR